MKRLILIALAVFLLAGCTHFDPQEQTVPGEPATHIIVTMPVLEGTDLRGLPQVQEAVNAITVPEIGVEVEFKTLLAQNSPTEYPNSIMAGKQIDLMLLNNENIKGYVEQEMLLSLDELLDRCGQDLQKLKENFVQLYDGAVLNERIYGLRIPSDQLGVCGALWVDPELLKQVSFHYEPEKIYTLAELDVLFSRLKAAYPEAYPLGQITNNYGFSTSPFFLGIAWDNLTASDPAALVVGSDSRELVNFYETDAYRNWIEYMRKWYLAGYIYPDSAITTASSIGLYRAGVVLSIPHTGSPGMLNEIATGKPVVPLRLSPICLGRSGRTGIFWTVPVTSREPEAAVKFLNLMYSDERIVNLLSWGIPGRDYEVNDAGIVTTLDSCLYSSALGVFGDQRLRYEQYGEALRQERAAFAAQAVPVNFQYAGFDFDSSALVQETLEIDRIESQYVKLLEAGCVDLDTAYPEFIQKLYDAGLQRVIDEKQRQFDAWLAEHEVK